VRLALTVVLLAVCSLAQGKPDFSGVFLRTQMEAGKHPTPIVPRILQVQQTADGIVATAIQNGETAVVHYQFDNKKIDAIQARLTADKLVVSATVKGKSTLVGFSTLPGISEHIETTWEMAHDKQQLIIRTKSDLGGSYSEAFTREPSLDAARAALAKANKISCDNPVSEWIRKTQRAGKYADGAFMGSASFDQITRCVGYEAGIFGDFFKNLKPKTKSNPRRFEKAGQLLSAYTGQLILEVQLFQTQSCADSALWTSTGNLAPDPIRDLRFMVRWMGSDTWDLDEVHADFIQEPWTKTGAVQQFYRMRIPAEGIPLTDALEVAIFSRTGEELACVKGHI